MNELQDTSNLQRGVNAHHPLSVAPAALSASPSPLPSVSSGTARGYSGGGAPTGLSCHRSASVSVPPPPPAGSDASSRARAGPQRRSSGHCDHVTPAPPADMRLGVGLVVTQLLLGAILALDIGERPESGGRGTQPGRH